MYTVEFTEAKSNALFNSTSIISLFIWETRLGKGSVQNIMENKLRHARGSVHLTLCPLHTPCDLNTHFSAATRNLNLPSGCSTSEP